MSVVKQGILTVNISDVVIDANIDMGAHTLKTDVVAESSSGIGVAVDGVENKDGKIQNTYLSYPWNILGSVWLRLFDVSAQESAPRGIFFNTDGSKMYIVGSDQEVNEYDLSTPWNISTAVWLQLFDVSGQELNPQGVFFKSDGRKMYIIGTIGKDVNEYDLPILWDVTSAVWLQLFNVSGQEGNPQGIFFKPDGRKMYVTGTTGQDVNEYKI